MTSQSATRLVERQDGAVHQLSIEQRLREYREWLNEEPFSVPVGESIFGRIQRDQENAGAHGEGFKPDIIVIDGEATACRPDGGMGRKMEQFGLEAARDNRCREIRDFLVYLPAWHLEVFNVLYTGPEHRQAREGAAMLGVSVGKLYERKAALIGWFEGAMFKSLFV